MADAADAARADAGVTGADPGATSDLPVGYPVGPVQDERLRDGSVVHVRPILPGDGDALVAFHDGLSSRSVYRRFFFVHPHLTADEVERFTHVDYVGRLALVAFDGDRMVGVGRYERLPSGDEAEVAFVVTDDHQHLGIGTLLLDHLADVARGHGITTFVAQTMSDNRDMVGMFLASGFPVETASSAGTVSLWFAIEPTPAYEAARAARSTATGEPTDGGQPSGSGR